MPNPTRIRPTNKTVRPNTPLVLSFDVEEHDSIEAAANLSVEPSTRENYRSRMVAITRWILDALAERGLKATFFVVGRIAHSEPSLIRAIVSGGHELACHGFLHANVLRMTPDQFRADLKQAKNALEAAGQAPVVGFRAPTFSITRMNPWALDVLAEEGFLYDSSIYPVRHDRYGVVDAPTGPFLARGLSTEILELPPATRRLAGANIPVGGGGYFRLLPWPVFRGMVKQAARQPGAGSPVLYFHPWEFDPDQPKLPLPRLSSFRTYVGIPRGQARLRALLATFNTLRAIDYVRSLEPHQALPAFTLAEPARQPA